MFLLLNHSTIWNKHLVKITFSNKNDIEWIYTAFDYNINVYFAFSQVVIDDTHNNTMHVLTKFMCTFIKTWTCVVSTEGQLIVI